MANLNTELSDPSARVEMGQTLPVKHQVDIHVGNRIRHRRWTMGLTQEHLANAVGVKFQQIQKYETGANRVSASRLWDIAGVLEVPINFFFENLQREGEDYKTSENGSADSLLDKETLQLVKLLHGVPVDQKRHLFELIRAMHDQGRSD